jgi:hypothetical protein
MVLGPTETGEVVVKQVGEGGPAGKAGIQPGDQILAADGIVIRSVYQAVRPLLYKQPGDTMTFDVSGRDGAIRTVEVVLGGGVVLPSAPSFKLANVIEPKVTVSGQPIVAARSARGGVAEVLAPAEGDDNAPLDPAAETIESLLGKIKLQERALELYRSALAAQKTKLDEAEAQRQQTEAQIRLLEAELELLKRPSPKSR